MQFKLLKGVYNCKLKMIAHISTRYKLPSVGVFLLTSFLPTTIGVEEGLRSLAASDRVKFDFEAWRSSFDGAVTMIFGRNADWRVEFDSVLDCEGDCEGAVIKGPKVLHISN